VLSVCWRAANGGPLLGISVLAVGKLTLHGFVAGKFITKLCSSSSLWTSILQIDPAQPLSIPVLQAASSQTPHFVPARRDAMETFSKILVTSLKNIHAWPSPHCCDAHYELYGWTHSFKNQHSYMILSSSESMPARRLWFESNRSRTVGWFCIQDFCWAISASGAGSG
jgi:hypothetical protein